MITSTKSYKHAWKLPFLIRDNHAELH